MTACTQVVRASHTKQTFRPRANSVRTAWVHHGRRRDLELIVVETKICALP